MNDTDERGCYKLGLLMLWQICIWEQEGLSFIESAVIEDVFVYLPNRNAFTFLLQSWEKIWLTLFLFPSWVFPFVFCIFFLWIQAKMAFDCPRNRIQSDANSNSRRCFSITVTSASCRKKRHRIKLVFLKNVFRGIELLISKL